MSLKFEKILVVSGMKRSGHHAVVNWLMRILDLELHVNDFSQKYGFETRFLEAAKQGLKKKDPSKIKTVIVSMEDRRVAQCLEFVDNLKKEYGCSVRTVHVLRDPFNCFASRLQYELRHHPGTKPRLLKHATAVWLDHARALFEQNFDYYIDYSFWTQSEKYRRIQALTMKAKRIETALGEVVDFGHGSSFSGFDISKGEQLDTYNRWRTHLQDKRYLSLFSSELMELAKKIFGENEAYLALREKL